MSIKRDPKKTADKLKRVFYANLDVPEEAFNMQVFYTKDDCGTVGCLIGNAIINDPYFQQNHLTWAENELHSFSPVMEVSQRNERLEEETALSEFFGLSQRDIHHLFYNNLSKVEALERLKDFVNNVLIEGGNLELEKL